MIWLWNQGFIQLRKISTKVTKQPPSQNRKINFKR